MRESSKVVKNPFSRFSGAPCAVLPDMIGRKEEEPGFMPVLADILGDASLREPGRFAALCAYR